MGGFATVFRQRLGAAGADAAVVDAIVAAAEAARAAAHAAWPGLAVDDDRFAAQLAGLVRDDPAPAQALAQLSAAEVYLTVGCADGLAEALAILERDYLAGLRPVLSRMGLAGAAIDETLQVMREELLAPRRDAAPRILNYGGRGQLRGWLRSVAARTGLRGVRATDRHAELDVAKHATADADLELAYMKKTYGEVFQRAFVAALAGLAADDRLLLRQRFRHGLTVEELGAMHSVHAGTISRWVAAARERLVKATRAEMTRELGVGRGDLSSIFRLIQSEIEITLSSHHDAS